VSLDSKRIVLLVNKRKFCLPSGCTLCIFHLSSFNSTQTSPQRRIKLFKPNFLAFTLKGEKGPLRQQSRRLNAVGQICGSVYVLLEVSHIFFNLNDQQCGCSTSSITIYVNLPLTTVLGQLYPHPRQIIKLFIFPKRIFLHPDGRTNIMHLIFSSLFPNTCPANSFLRGVLGVCFHVS
jgi:hypothetical protein